MNNEVNNNDVNNQNGVNPIPNNNIVNNPINPGVQEPVVQGGTVIENPAPNVAPSTSVTPTEATVVTPTVMDNPGSTQVGDAPVNNVMPNASQVINPTPTPSVSEQPVTPMGAPVANPTTEIQNTPMGQVMDVPVTPEPAPIQNTGLEVNNTFSNDIVGTPQQTAPTSFTNPQNINPNPMPGYNSTIGTTPPISLEPEKKPEQKKKMNKILFVILLVIAMGMVGFLVYLLLTGNTFGSLASGGSNSGIKINVRELEIPMGNSLPKDINEYADISGTDVKNCSLNLQDVNNNVEGNYEYSIKCGEIVAKGKLHVVDKNELVVNTQTVYKTVDSELNIKEFIIDADAEMEYEFKDAEAIRSNLATKGTYSVVIIAKKGSKTAEATAQLVVLDSKIKGHITCSSNEEELSDIGALMVVKEKFMLIDDGNNSYGGVAEEIHEFRFTDETKYKEYLSNYQNDKSLTINEISGKPIFDDTEHTITFVENRDNDKVLEEYGKDNMEKFGTIFPYFGNLGYKCSFTKAS